MRPLRASMCPLIHRRRAATSGWLLYRISSSNEASNASNHQTLLGVALTDEAGRRGVTLPQAQPL